MGGKVDGRGGERWQRWNVVGQDLTGPLREPSTSWSDLNPDQVQETEAAGIR